MDWTIFFSTFAALWVTFSFMTGVASVITTHMMVKTSLAGKWRAVILYTLLGPVGFSSLLFVALCLIRQRTDCTHDTTN